MEIESLTLVMTNEDLNQMMQQHLPSDVPVKEMVAEIEAGGIRLRGKYSMAMMAVPFDTFWVLTVQDSVVRAHLDQIKIVGMPAKMLQGVFMGNIDKMTAGETGVHVEKEDVVIHSEEVLRAQGLSIKLNLREINCTPGKLTLRSSV